LRRQDQEITDQHEIEAILARATVCRLGLIDEGQPYVVPVCYAYCGNSLYIHSAPEGRKIDVLRRCPTVCFEVEVDVEMEPASKPCAWGIRYASVMGWGQATFLHDVEEKRAALDLLMTHYGAERPYTYNNDILAKTCIIRVNIDQLSGKRSRR